MENVYGTFGYGPSSAVKPSSGSWVDVYKGSSAVAPSAEGTNAA